MNKRQKKKQLYKCIRELNAESGSIKFNPLEVWKMYRSIHRNRYLKF